MSADLTRFTTFPPFYTIQPNLQTREKQLQIWKEHICQSCQSSSTYFISIANTIFSNTAINRRISSEGFKVIGDYMVINASGVWVDPGNKTKLLVLWRTIPEWSAVVYNWAVAHGKLNSVETVYSLHSGDDVRGTELENIPTEILNLALSFLQSQHKCVVFKGNTSEDDGVKFLT